MAVLFFGGAPLLCVNAMTLALTAVEEVLELEA